MSHHKDEDYIAIEWMVSSESINLPVLVLFCNVELEEIANPLTMILICGPNYSDALNCSTNKVV